MSGAPYSRGSEWRQWDLHIHLPASFHWKGEKFSPARNTTRDIELVDEMIAAMNAAAPAVFAIQDYWTFDGWFALKRRLKQKGAPKLTKTVFPGIELRLSAPMASRLNAHVIFSDETPDQDLIDFLARLRLELTDQPLSDAALIAYARRVGADKLAHHGFDKSGVDAEDAKALDAGQHIAELKAESYRQSVSAVPNGRAICFMPFSTSGGLGTLKWIEHYAYAISLFEAAAVFEARDDATWNAFVGRKTNANARWIDSFQSALGMPRLPVSGSDAHQFVGVNGDNNRRGYGDYPGDRITWLKADPTWLGLLQAIKEPQKRCHIGEMPPKMRRISENKTFYVDEISIQKMSSSGLQDPWFHGCKIPINPDLAVIIGNKGSGKSALADVIALLGNSQEQKHFSFLRPDRFRGKSGEPARQFTGTLTWLAGDESTGNLADDPTADRVELVRYIPQGRFEALCNDHVAGRSNAFERELRGVIFSHIPAKARLGALSFDQLIDQQEKLFRARLSEARKRLGDLNRWIAGVEDEMHPDIKRNIEEQLRLKRREVDELVANKPAPVSEPSEALSEAQKAAALRIEDAGAAILTLEATLAETSNKQTEFEVRKRAASAALERIELFRSQVGEFEAALSEDLIKVGLALEDVVSVSLNDQRLRTVVADALAAEPAFAERLAELRAEIEVNRAKISEATESLNEPQRIFQAYRVAQKDWEDRLAALKGAPDVPESVRGFEARLEQIDALGDRLAALRLERRDLCGHIYDILAAQRDARANLFGPLQTVIAENELIRDDYRLQFQANLTGTADAISENIFAVVKQNVGDLRGDEESRLAIKRRYDARDMNDRTAAIQFAEDIHDLLQGAARKAQASAFDIRPLLRKDRTAAEVYDFVFGLEYLSPQYTLLFQDTPIEQLSPGQRGALLLIFYLLVDKARNPIILDQPEENLDNETIVGLLVPVLNLAKQNRQIIMVTHNPNLAVVCDAEQIVRATFARKDGASITYESGSIENPKLNLCVVNILEGTKAAFDNRSGKYH